MYIIELLLPPYNIYDILVISFVFLVCALGSFYSGREYVREGRRQLDAPKSKLVVSIIFGVIGLVFAIPMLISWVALLFFTR